MSILERRVCVHVVTSGAISMSGVVGVVSMVAKFLKDVGFGFEGDAGGVVCETGFVSMCED